MNRYVRVPINPRQRTALANLYRHKQITNPEYCRLNNVDSQVATRELRGLVEAGVVTMQGMQRWSRYTLTETPAEGQIAKRQSTINDRQQKALDYLRKTGRITTTEYILQVGEPISKRTAQRDLRQLEDLGLIRQIGKALDVHYVLAKRE